MREAWKLAADYYMALKGSISVWVRRTDSRTRIAGAVAVVALALMGLHWFNSSGGIDDRAAESAGAGGSTRESPHVDDGPTAAAATPQGSSPAPTGRAGLATSRDSSGATASDGAAGTQADDPRSLAERDDATASAAGTSSGAVSSDSAQASGSTSPAPSSGGDPAASQPSADGGSEPDEECTPDSGLITGLVGGLVCLVDDLS